MAASLLLLLEPAARLVPRTKPHDARVAGEFPRPLATVTQPRAKRPGEQRLAPPERAAPALAVAAPELDLAADSLQGPPPEAPQCDPERRVERDDTIGGGRPRGREDPLLVGVGSPTGPGGAPGAPSPHPRVP